MMRTFRHIHAVRYAAGVLCALFILSCVPVRAAAEESLSVSVTPPLFQLSIGPGEFWASNIKVVNNNSYDVSYYADVVDFEAEGEDGRSKFTPLIKEPDEGERTFSLARWIDISSAPVVVRKGESAEIPFSVRVPEDAEPGGHYAAILIGTQPGKLTDAAGPSVSVASYVSSLLFVRIKGDVVESGRVREFRTNRSLYQKPTADFLLRFENTGNTHLQPQGDITIYNTWGKERGTVAINQDTNFGNVLPRSTRKFEFTWMSESDPLDIGRYRAIVTLTYGEDSRQNVTATTYFWVVPILPVALVVGGFFSFVFLMLWFIRAYVRKALTFERRRLSIDDISTPIPTTIETLIEPLKEGVVDLRRAALRAGIAVPVVEASPSVPEIEEVPKQSSRATLRRFFRQYHLFFAFIAVLLLGSLGIWWYASHAFAPRKDFEISAPSRQGEVIREPAFLREE